MPTPLNTFKTTTANVTTGTTTVYTTPSGITTVVLLAQASNIGGNVVGVTATHLRSSVPTKLIANVQIPPMDAISLLSGKLVLQDSDSITISASANNEIQFLLSYLETTNP